MKIEVNLNKRYFSLILGSILLLAGVFVVYAYAGVGLGTPATFGHSGGEVDVNYNEDLSSVQSAVDDLDQRLGALENVVPDDPTADPFISKSRQVMEFEDFVEPLPPRYTWEDNKLVTSLYNQYSDVNHPGIVDVEPGNSLSVFKQIHSSDQFVVSFLLKFSKSGSNDVDIRFGPFTPSSTGAFSQGFAFRVNDGNISAYVDTTRIGFIGSVQFNNEWVKYRIQREGDEVVYYVNDTVLARTTASTPRSHTIWLSNQKTEGTASIDYVGLIINGLQREKLNCNTELSLPTGYSTVTTSPNVKSNGYIPITIPSACTDTDGCVLKREIRKSTGLATIHYSTAVMKQDGSNKWRVNSGSLRTNGDSTSSALFSEYYNLRFVDDSSIEKNPNQWSFYDGSTTYMQKIYLCTAS